MEHVNSQYAGANEGWSAWFDRHSGIDVYGCSLDSYMNQFNKSNTAFHPHGRNNTNSVDQSTNHMWTPGSEGWGLEIQGSFDYSYAACYSSFDWCTSSSDPTVSTGWKCKDGYTWDDEAMKVRANPAHAQTSSARARCATANLTSRPSLRLNRACRFGSTKCIWRR